MTALRWRAFVLSLAMCCAALAAALIKPTARLADQGERLNLERMIPRQFGDWVMDERQSALVVNPQGEDLVSQLYQQVISRTYLNPVSGQAIMLSIAYGENQSHSHDLHVPDICYAAGGFQIKKAERGELSTPYGAIPVKRLVTQLSQRREPLTYWVIVGQKIASGALGPKLIALGYGLQGVIPDGIIFRVSSVGSDDEAAFAAQQTFVQNLFDVLSSHDRNRLAGLSAS